MSQWRPKVVRSFEIPVHEGKVTLVCHAGALRAIRVTRKTALILRRVSKKPFSEGGGQPHFFDAPHGAQVGVWLTTPIVLDLKGTLTELGLDAERAGGNGHVK